MSPGIVGLISFVVLYGGLAVGVPIGFAFLGSGFLGLLLLAGFDPAFSIISLVPYGHLARYVLAVVPLFILMGEFAVAGNLSKDGYYAAKTWLGHFRGGLAMSTSAASALFGAVCGSQAATSMTMTAVAWPEMKRYGYSPALGLGSICAAGPIAVLIPPSMPLIIYAMLSEQSVGRLLIAGIGPGLLLAVIIIITTIIITKIKPDLAPVLPKATWKERFNSMGGTWAVALLIIFVFSAVWLGVVTPNEAGGFGAIGALLIIILKHRLNWRALVKALSRTAISSGAMLNIFIGMGIFTTLMSYTRLPQSMAAWIVSMNIPPMAVIWCIVLIYLILGCLLDAAAVVFLTVPLFVPLIISLGFDPIWFGILMVILTSLGNLTPPVGINIFIIHGIVKEEGIPMSTLFKGVTPYFASFLVCTTLLIYFPTIATWLPGTMMG